MSDLPALQLREENLLPSVKAYLQTLEQQLLRWHEEKRDPTQVILLRTESIDRLLVSLFKLAQDLHRKEPKSSKSEDLTVTLLSQGGYGRKELCLHSDIDLLFLYEGKADPFLKLFTGRILQTLWDAGLEVGFATRTVKDCKKLLESDLTILTALIDARFIAGEPGLAEKVSQMIDRYFASEKNRDRFVRLKMDENKERQERYGDSVYLLEPNLKEGEGGLRDYHTLYWIARIYGGIQSPQELVNRNFLTQEEFDQLWEALKFLWTIRNELHRRTGRRSDQMLFEFQEPIAHWLGFENTTQFLGVELFMQRYYAQAKCIYQLTERSVKKLHRVQPKLFSPPKIVVDDEHFRILDGKLTIASPQVFEQEPLYLLKIFQMAHHLDLPIDDFAKEKIEKNLFRIDDTLQSSPEAGRVFRQMLKKHRGLGKRLVEMNDLGVLGAYLPEFQKLRFRVQHDIYHVYTVDVHSIFAVGELGNLEEGDYATTHPTLHELIREIEKKDLLAFATLYHDIGKGEGRGHVEKGAPLIRRAGARLGFSAAEVDTLEFLELSHLLMTHLAFRRDLEDQNLIIQFAKSMQNLELLNMLYLQTFCDVKGVSAEAMTDWKASLLEYLYLKTREVIQKGSFTKERASALVPKVLEDVFKLLGTDHDKIKCREFFAMMAPRYLLSVPPPMIVRHVKLWEIFAGNPIVFESRFLEREGLNEVTLFTRESPALFSRMAGLFAAHNINIIESQLNVSNQGHALQIFKVADHEGRAITDPEKWTRIEKDLRDVLEGRVRIENLVAEKFRPSLFKKKVAQQLPTQIEIDNDLSAYYTVIDIYTSDRVGLLYQITSTLSALSLYVDVSKISTKVDQVADTFYVKDIFGHKITSQERLNKIREILQKVVEEEPVPGWRPPGALLEKAI